jgi:AcrR family transcriptional regulator
MPARATPRTKPATSPALHDKASETTGKGYARARSILKAARTLFAREGYGGMSMRAVAVRVGVNLSTVQHYYPSKDALLEAVLLQMLENYQANTDRHTALHAGGPSLAQFEALIDYVLDDLSTPESNGVFRELWALANHNPFAAEILGEILTRARKVFRNLIRRLRPDLPRHEGDLRGALIVAQLQGLVLFLPSARQHDAELKGLKAAARRAIVQLAVAE